MVGIVELLFAAALTAAAFAVVHEVGVELVFAAGFFLCVYAVVQLWGVNVGVALAFLTVIIVVRMVADIIGIVADKLGDSDIDEVAVAAVAVDAALTRRNDSGRPPGNGSDDGGTAEHRRRPTARAFLQSRPVTAARLLLPGNRGSDEP